MQRIYKLPNQELITKGNNNSLITNNYGGYFATIPASNYSGWYLLDAENWNMHKLIESITPLDVGEQTNITNQFYALKREFEQGEDFVFPYNNTLFYNTQKLNGKIRLTLDARNIYEESKTGREYNIYQEENTIIIEFKHEDKTSFIAIKGIDSFEQINSWKEKNYSEDAKRNTGSKYWVFDAIDLDAKSYVVFSHGETKAIAKTRADIAFYHFDEILNYKHTTLVENIPEFKEITHANVKMAASSSFWSLNELTNSFAFSHKQMPAIYAGLPWFFQIWSRDELISLGGFLSCAEHDIYMPLSRQLNLPEDSSNHILHFSKTVLARYINSINAEGKIQNLFPNSSLDSLDAFGWLGKRIYDFLAILKETDLTFEILTDDDLRVWFEKMYQGLEDAKQTYGKQGLFANGYCETWMDTVYGDEGRPGYCIEIQALFLKVYDALILLSKLIGSDKTSSLKYEQNKLESLIRKTFVSKEFSGLLLDRVFPEELNFNEDLAKKSSEISSLSLDSLKFDRTIRPNVFLAAYLAPEILSSSEWSVVFEHHLQELFLAWGGLSSIPKTHSLFQPTSTGHDNKSYHRGDSWYFINNIVALVLYKKDKEKYREYINKIINASAKDILECGFSGHASEISSAEIQMTAGTGAQAWSASTFLELVKEIHNED